jgi:hypothetical protein
MIIGISDMFYEISETLNKIYLNHYTVIDIKNNIYTLRNNIKYFKCSKDYIENNMALTPEEAFVKFSDKKNKAKKSYLLTIKKIDDEIETAFQLVNSKRK